MSFLPSTTARLPCSSRSLLPSTSSAARRHFTPTPSVLSRRRVGPSTMGIAQSVKSDFERNGPLRGRPEKKKEGPRVDYKSDKPVLEGGKFNSVSSAFVSGRLDSSSLGTEGKGIAVGKLLNGIDRRSHVAELDNGLHYCPTHIVETSTPNRL